MLNEIKETFDRLTSLIQSSIEKQDELEKREKLLNDFDFKLREREKKLEGQETDLSIQENKLKSDKLLIDEKYNELEKDKLQLQQVNNKLDELDRKQKSISEKQSNLDERENKIKEGEKELEKLSEIRIELDHRETLLKKEMLMDKLRQDKMDERDALFEKEKDRIQKIAQRLGEKLVV
jgi:DNA repair exonuclease SbcCD ATPase subunit